MNICLFAQEEIDKPLDLADSRAEHIIKILKKKVGDTFSAGIIGGMAGIATITALNVHKEISQNGKKELLRGELFFTFEAKTDGKPLRPLCMVIGFPRPIQLKRLLRDMASLGVAEVHLTSTELGEKSYLNSTLATTDAAKTMLLDGSVQAASTHIPALFMHKSLEECLKKVQDTKRDIAGGIDLLALDNVDANKSLSSYLKERKIARYTVACIGSERGWSQNERKILESYGYSRLEMGNRVLRTETAATVAATLILNSLGALG